MANASHLLHATKHHCKTPIELWDGNQWVASPVLVNLLRAPHDHDTTVVNTMHTLPNALPDTVFNFRLKLTQEVWSIIDHQPNERQGVHYNDHYHIRKSPYLTTAMRQGEGVTASSGMSYTPTDSEIIKFWCIPTHDRYQSTGRPISRQGVDQVFETFAPHTLVWNRGTDTLEVDNDSKYLIRTAERSTARGVLMYLSLWEN